MKIAVVDDEILYLNRIKKCLQDYKEIQLFCFSNIEELDAFYDLILLDIDLGNVNAIEWNKLNISRTTPVVFVTNHEKYYKDAYFYNVLGFVLKDNLETDLPRKVYEIFSNLHENIIEIKVDHNMKKVNESEIMYFYMEDTILYMKKRGMRQSIKTTERSMTLLNDKLSDSFFRINRNTIINLNQLEKVKIETCSCIMLDQKEFLITRRCWKPFLHAYNKVRSHL